MAQRSFTWSNKLGAGYPAKPVWLTGGGGGLENFAADRQQLGRADRRGGSIWARVDAAPRADGTLQALPSARTDFQRFFADQLGQVARVKSHKGQQGAVSCGAAVPSRFIASFQTGGTIKADRAPGASGLVADQGGVFPLSVAVLPPYPGRARQTQDLEKPAQGPACIAGRIQRSRPTVRNRGVLLSGSGVRAASERASSGGATGRGCGRGAGIGGFAGSRHFRLDQGKTAKLGGGRG